MVWHTSRVISTAAEATSIFQHHLDDMSSSGERYYVVEVADVGPIWRALFTYDGARPTWRSLLRLDKTTGEVENDMETLQVGPCAHDGYVAMMKTTVRPTLRQLGMVGKNTVFKLPDPDHFATLSLQPGRANRWAYYKLTANVSVIPRAAWSDHARERGYTGLPHPDMHYGIGWQTRIGMLSRHGNDYWWEIWAGFPTKEVAIDLCEALRLSVAAMTMEIAGTFRISHRPDN
jgi:hypothetical protein